jgi:competence ComEA-like helix-hairpin-helix protein
VNILKHISSIRDRLALSKAEERVALFVLGVLAVSIGLRAVGRANSAPEPVPASFARMDSVFHARAAAVAAPGVTYDALLAGGRKPTIPAAGVDVNRATAAQLTSLPGVGPKMAQRIIAFRERTPFRRAEDLRRIKGIGPRMFDRIRPYVRVE